MNQSRSVRIQAEAAEALAQWKAFFAEQVAVKAKESNSPDVVTLSHYRQAAVLAASLLAVECRTHTQTMAVKKQPESDAGELSESANDWFRQFLKHLELFMVETGQGLPTDSRQCELSN